MKELIEPSSKEKLNPEFKYENAMTRNGYTDTISGTISSGEEAFDYVNKNSSCELNYTVTSDANYLNFFGSAYSDYNTVDSIQLSAPVGSYNYNAGGEDSFNSFMIICPETNNYNEGIFYIRFHND